MRGPHTGDGHRRLPILSAHGWHATGPGAIGIEPMEQSNSLEKPTPSSVEALVGLCRSGHLAGAEVRARDLLRDFPDDLALNDILAGILAEQGRLQEAIAAYGKAVETRAMGRVKIV